VFSFQAQQQVTIILPPPKIAQQVRIILPPENINWLWP